jgi:hypothetical protein
MAKETQHAAMKLRIVTLQIAVIYAMVLESGPQVQWCRRVLVKDFLSQKEMAAIGGHDAVAATRGD